MEDYIKIRTECEMKGHVIVKLYMKMAKIYKTLIRGIIISAVLFVLDFFFFNKQYGKTFIFIIVTAIAIMLAYWINLTYKNTYMRKIVSKYEHIEKKDDFHSLIKLLQFYKYYEEIKEMEKLGELTYATKESEETIFINNQIETRPFKFGSLCKEIVLNKNLNFSALDQEFLRLKRVISR